MLGGMAGPVGEKQREFICDIRESGRHLLALINDILDLSKIEAGRMELAVTRFDLPLAIGNALALVRERAGRHGIKLEASLAPDVAEYDGDERKVKQIVLNLLTNAVKFTPEGGAVTLDASRVDGSTRSRCGTRGSASPPTTSTRSSRSSGRSARTPIARPRAPAWDSRSPGG
jgi:signal transduction histidine kinase